MQTRLAALALVLVTAASGAAHSAPPAAPAKSGDPRAIIVQGGIAATPKATAVQQSGDPRTIIVQGGIAPDAPCTASPAAMGDGAAVAIGPKQDDPAPPPPALGAGSKKTITGGREAGSGQASGKAALAIGPKQDDPAPPPPAATAARCSPASR